MGDLLSQPHTEQPTSLIHAFPTEYMYSHEYSDSFQRTGSFQHTTREDSPIKVAAPPPKLKSTRGRQKRTVQNKDVPRHTARTNKEETTLCKGWIHAPGRRRYDMINGKWKTVRPNVARICRMYANVMHKARDSGAGDEDYLNRVLIDYETRHGMQFALCHCWETSGSSSFNTESEDVSINLNVDVGDDEEDEVNGLRAGNAQPKCHQMKKEQHLAFLEIKMREAKCRERELAM
nr:hypothetical protein [Tanacetum cinerariifolium]